MQALAKDTYICEKTVNAQNKKKTKKNKEKLHK